MEVRVIMTESLATCSPDTNLQDVARMMVDHDCGAIPVLENDRPMAIITDRDITCRIVAKGENPLEKTARDAMTANVVTIKPTDNVDEAKRQMENNKVRRLVVVDESGTCRGVVSQADLARRASEREAGDVVSDVSEPTREPSEVS